METVVDPSKQMQDTCSDSLMWVWSSHNKKIQTKFDLETTVLLYIVTPSGIKNKIVCRQIGEIRFKIVCRQIGEIRFDSILQIWFIPFSFRPVQKRIHF